MSHRVVYQRADLGKFRMNRHSCEYTSTRMVKLQFSQTTNPAIAAIMNQLEQEKKFNNWLLIYQVYGGRTSQPQYSMLRNRRPGLLVQPDLRG